MRIAIDAQISSVGLVGGIEQFISGLVHALGSLEGNNDEYVIVTSATEPNWLDDCLGPNQRVVHFGAARKWLGPMMPALRRVRRTLRELTGAPPALPSAHGFYESLGVEVVHFPHARFVASSLPSVYNPHDLQHLHYPEFFSGADRAMRETIYRHGCRHATAVVLLSEWARRDFIEKYGLDHHKTAVVRAGPYQTPTVESPLRIKEKFGLPEVFALFPAQTWPHKNHLFLLECLRTLRDESGLRINLVCSGRLNDFSGVIRDAIRDLDLTEQVWLLDHVAPGELRALYRQAQFLVFPSLFEGGGLPIIEAFYEQLPVTCSDRTSLPEYGGDAVLLFDPTSRISLVSALSRMATETDLRSKLVENSRQQIKLFEWRKAAEEYRNIYRKAVEGENE